jgi:hypothetical protein
MLRVLLATANNPDQPLDLEYEHREILIGLGEADATGGASVEVLPAVTFEDLERRLLVNGYDVLHFSGHGGKYGSLYFRGELGQNIAVSPAQLASLLKVQEHMKCVILNACYSLRGAFIINKNVPFTVAAEEDLLDPVASAFSRAMYRSLASGKPGDAAYIDAVAACVSRGFFVTRLPVLLRQTDPEIAAQASRMIPLSGGDVYYPDEIAAEGYCRCERNTCVGQDTKIYCYFPTNLSPWVRKTGLFYACYDEMIECRRCGLLHKRGHIGRKSACGKPYANQRLQRD